MPTTRPAKRTAPATANRLGRAPSASTAGRCRGPRIKASAPVAFLLPQPYFILAALEARMDRVEVRPGVEATRDFALLLREERVLVISDLHLGFEGALAEQGVSIPRFQRRVILERLGKMLDRNKAEQVVIAGDLKHDLGATVSVPAFLVTEPLLVLPAFSPLALGVDVSSYPYLSPILNRTPIDDARVIGVDEKEGLLDFGPMKRLQEISGALLMK